jgi:hypothetical protein
MAKCDQLTVNGEPCKKDAMQGHTRCAFHIGPHVGSRTLLTPELADSLIAMLRAGNYVQVAVRAVGIRRQTLTKWLERGESTAPEDEPYAQLRERVEQARAEGEVRNVAQISKAASDSWQAAAWLLERQYPDRWGRTSVRVRDEEDQVVEDVEADDPFAEVDELAAARRKRIGA